MFHATITLTWPDGQSATAALQAASAEAEYAVVYGGAVARLADAPARSDWPFLSWSLRRVAIETGAAYAEQLSGHYDRHAV